MRSCTLMLAICALVPCAVRAQQSWERNYGGPDHDYGRSVQQTSDGGYIVAGYTRSFGDSSQVYLVKTNASGDTLWTKTYGGARDEEGVSVQRSAEGGYIVSGVTHSYGDGGNVYLVKTDASGDTFWTRNFGGAGFDEGLSIQRTRDWGYIIAGVTTSFGNGQQIYLVKTNSSGDTLWTRVYGGTYLDCAYSVQQTLDGGYIVAGWTSSFGTSFQVYLIKTDSSGDTVWTRTYGGTGTEFCGSVQQTTDSGYIVVGHTDSHGDSNQVYLVKTNSAGDTTWTRTYGGALNDYGLSVAKTQDGGYVVAGYTRSFGAGGTDAYIIRTNANGDSLWTRFYGGTDDDLGNEVQQTSDGGFVVAGYTFSYGSGSGEVYLVKTDANGNIGVAETPSAKARAMNTGPTVVRGVLLLPSSRLSAPSSLLSIDGRKVLNLHPGANDVRKLAPGVYFVRGKPSALGCGQSADSRLLVLK